jgi:hypothetical protein
MKIKYDNEEEIFNVFLEALQKRAIQVDNIDIARIWIKERIIKSKDSSERTDVTKETIIYKWTWQFDSYRKRTK